MFDWENAIALHAMQGNRVVLGCGVLFFVGIQHPPVDACSAASCNFGAGAGEDEHMSFYSAILQTVGGSRWSPVLYVMVHICQSQSPDVTPPLLVFLDCSLHLCLCFCFVHRFSCTIFS